MIETLATVDSNREITPGYRLLSLRFQQDITVSPGQFAMLKAHNSLEPLLRRALAVYRVLGPRSLGFLYQVLGPGTKALSQVAEGGLVEALLPLGNSWPIHHSANKRAIVVAGGIGSASLLMLCEGLVASDVDTQLFFGAAGKHTAAGCGLGDFRNLGLQLTVTTDDGSLGEPGFVTDPLERHLSEGGGSGAAIYACGPWAMMRQVARLAGQFDVPCLVSLEAPMGCGFGVCVGCVVAVNGSGPLGYDSYKRVCTDGSIFPAEKIRWEVNAMNH